MPSSPVVVVACEASRVDWGRAVVDLLERDRGMTVALLLPADSTSTVDVELQVGHLARTLVNEDVQNLVVSTSWQKSFIESYAVTTALGLGIDVVEMDEERPSARFDTFITEFPDGMLTKPAVAADSSPDENRDERPHEEAARIVLGPRGAYYDHPFDNFARTAHIWTGVLYSKLRDGETVSPEDVAMCMVGVKVAREAFRHKRDNLTDAHGYLLTLEMVLEERDRRERDAD